MLMSKNVNNNVRKDSPIVYTVYIVKVIFNEHKFELRKDGQ